MTPGYTLSEVRRAPHGGYQLTAKVRAPAGTRTLRVKVTAEGYAEAGSPEEGTLPAECFRLLFGEADDAACRERACKLLATAPQSRRAMTEKLLLRGFDPGAVTVAVRDLVSRGYLDEEGQAARLAEIGMRRFYSRRRLLDAIRRRGYSLETAEAALGAVGYDEREVARRLVAARLGEDPDDDERAVLLAKAGFDTDL